MRIITGLYKGRHFDIPRTFKARPTTDFAKENIFNVLQGYIDFDDLTALDLFAGTGSISLLIRGDVFKFLKTCRQSFDFIFADPPYNLKELPLLPDLILENTLLKPKGLLVLEHGKDYDFSHHPRFVEHRQYGSVNFSIFQQNNI